MDKNRHMGKQPAGSQANEKLDLLTREINFRYLCQDNCVDRCTAILRGKNLRTYCVKFFTRRKELGLNIHVENLRMSEEPPRNPLIVSLKISRNKKICLCAFVLG
jgi:hypothetical protein